jgi:hypothetical protein
MVRNKKVENETEDQAAERRLREKISNTANRSDKVSWNRKLDNMIKLVAQVNRLQEQIQDLEEEKEPIVDQIAALRQVMVNECVHPFDQIVVEENHSLCKFCGKKIVVVNDG